VFALLQVDLLLLLRAACCRHLQIQPMAAMQDEMGTKVRQCTLCDRYVWWLFLLLLASSSGGATAG
jgi:hypothetical protein